MGSEMCIRDRYLLFVCIGLHFTIHAQMDQNGKTYFVPLSKIEPQDAGEIYDVDTYSMDFNSGPPSLSLNKDNVSFQIPVTPWRLVTSVDREGALKKSRFETNTSNTPPKHFTELKDGGPVFQRDQYLGDYTTSSDFIELWCRDCLLYTSPSPRDLSTSRMPSSA